ncbi:MAG: tRNA (adenosine(37)-N6)-threonylcarbamoyltransferase complex ATPase subunit type 1 TsaE [Pseudomonadota bacterium]
MNAARLILFDETETHHAAQRLAGALRPGVTILLDGPIGAGKTFFARALIQTRLAALGRMEDVPSPTFTLVQVYELGDFDIWHCDLYRLDHPDEVFDLGLTEAMEEAVCLIEWPNRLGDLVPANALRLSFSPGRDENARLLTARGPACLTNALKVPHP